MSRQCDVCFDACPDPQMCLNNARFELVPAPCTFAACPECFDEFLALCRRDKLLPRCPTCRSLFQPRPRVVAELAEWLRQAGDDNAIMHEDQQYQRLVERLVESRQRFLVEDFPPAISSLANVMFPDRLRRLGKQQRERLRHIVERSSGQRCIVAGCWGSTFLNGDGRRCCFACSCQQCPQCQERWQPEHRCSQEVLDTLATMNKESVECPGCGTRIQRSQGCDNMTCSRCHCNFSYSTGQMGGGGNHGQNTATTSLETLLLDRSLDLKLQHFHDWCLCMQKCLRPRSSASLDVRELYRKMARSLFLAQQHDTVELVRQHVLHRDQQQQETWEQLDERLQEVLHAFRRIMTKYSVKRSKD